MLQFCSYLHALPQRINLKASWCTVNVLVPPFPKNSHLLWPSSCKTHVTVMQDSLPIWILSLSRLQPIAQSYSPPIPRYSPCSPILLCKKNSWFLSSPPVLLRAFQLNSPLNQSLSLPGDTRKLFVHSDQEQGFLSVLVCSWPQQLLGEHLLATRMAHPLQRKGSAPRFLKDEVCFRMGCG